MVLVRKLVGLGCMLLAAGVVHAQEAVPETVPKQPAAVHKPAGKLPVMPNKVARASGKLFVQVNAWDFGHVPQDVQVSHRFIIENVGDDTLFLERIKPT
jgi:hypothetical protein